MKVILLQSVNKLGEKGEIKDVNKGYAINFLISNNLACVADKRNLNLLEIQKKKSKKNKAEKKSPKRKTKKKKK